MHKTQRLLSVLLGGLASLLLSSSVQAVPNFARQEGVKCSTCHTAWPQLNAKGRAFKENGYRFPEDRDEPRTLSDLIETGIPAGALLVARPYDNKNGTQKNRAFHEFELFLGGALNDRWSGFAEVEAEDETDFSPEIATGVVGFHPSPALNLLMAWSNYFWSDSSGLLRDGLRMTRGHVAAINEGFGGVDGGAGLRGTRQIISLYGRPLPRLFYSLGYSGIAKDAEGADASNVSARLALDVLPDVTLGGFHVDGKNDTSGLSFKRSGVDLQADIGNARVQGLFVSADDDLAGGGSESNNAWALQGMYVIKRGARPAWVPLVRLDGYERNDGQDSYRELTVNLTRYFAQNIKGYLEYWKQLDVPRGASKSDRVTVQVSVAF